MERPVLGQCVGWKGLEALVVESGESSAPAFTMLPWKEGPISMPSPVPSYMVAGEAMHTLCAVHRHLGRGGPAGPSPSALARSFPLRTTLTIMQTSDGVAGSDLEHGHTHSSLSSWSPEAIL